MRFLKPLLAGATLMAIAVPALASAQPYEGRQDYRVHRAYERGLERGYDHRAFRDRGFAFFHVGVIRHDRFAFRDHWRREHRWDHRGW